MSLFQFLRILYARRMFLLIALISCVSVATVAAFVLPKQYKASARVMLDIVKPDPVNGQVIANQFLHAYTNTQIELIRDQQVAGLVVDQMGWMSSPEVISAYQRSTGGKGQDMRHWLASRVIDGTKADLIENSNILEISYTDRSAADAARIAGALRSAFIDSTLQSRRDLAGRAADWFKTQVDKAKILLADAEAARTQFARSNSIVLQADNVDLESARLQALSSQSATQASAERQVYPGDAAPAINTAKTQLEQIDQQLAQAKLVIGPNHPTYQLLQRQRGVLEAEVARERRTAHTKTQGDAQAAFAEQKARVVAQRDKIDQLNLMQRDIDVKRQQYVEASKRLGELRMEADVSEAGLTSLGDVIVPDKPYFPNKPLIIGGAVGFGAALGIVLSLLIELVQRRVRCAEDLEYGVSAEVLATIGELRPAKSIPRRMIGYFESRARLRRALKKLATT
jgi:uncharacterized protein involved in exopolysaccharide biosynthesis